MKNTRKLSVIYFVISMAMLLMVCFGCEANTPTDVDYNEPFLTYDIVEHECGTVVNVGVNDFIKDDYDKLMQYVIQMMDDKGYQSYVIQYRGINVGGIIEVEDGVITYQSK